jgi:hypothetical protein
VLGAAGRRPPRAAAGALPTALRGAGTVGRPPAERGSAYAGQVLSGLRDSSGGPNLRVKVLAVVVALLLAGPLTVALLRGLMAVVDLLV